MMKKPFHAIILAQVDVKVNEKRGVKMQVFGHKKAPSGHARA